MGREKFGEGHYHCGGVANATINEALKPFYSFFAASLAALHRLHKISPSTIARTAALALALTNQILSTTGHAVLPIESAQLEQLVSTGLTVAAALVSWWKNNSFTPEAIEADDYFYKLKSGQ